MWVTKAATAAALVVGGHRCAVPAYRVGADPTRHRPRHRHRTAPKTSIDADGTYAVGTDIAPGVYSTAGPVGDGTCFWKRLGSPTAQRSTTR